MEGQLATATTKELNVGVVGPAGFTGSHVCVELLARGHKVRGISRNPEKFGQHERYTPVAVDFSNAGIEELAATMKNLDVLINACGPKVAGPPPAQYEPFLETTRKIVLAAKAARVGYFIMVGGCGSLHMPGNPSQCSVDNDDFMLAYRRACADSKAHNAYMQQRLETMGIGEVFSGMKAYGEARSRLRNGNLTDDDRRLMEEFERAALRDDGERTFIRACRTSYMFFDGNKTFRWTFVSPPAMYRPGKRTGAYEIQLDEVPMKPGAGASDSLDGRLQGISVADLAIAMADEAEKRANEGRHWSAFADMSDDEPRAMFLTAADIPSAQ